MSVVLHSARDADLAVLAALHSACFPEEAWDSAALATVLAMPGAAGRIAIDEAQSISGLLIDQCLGEDAEILTLCVAPASRRGGVARRLIADLVIRARALGAHRILLEVAADNRPALTLYEAMGFYRQGTRTAYYRRANRPAVDAWRLCLDLPAAT